jgi:hypothetical protein
MPTFPGSGPGCSNRQLCGRTRESPTGTPGVTLCWGPFSGSEVAKQRSWLFAWDRLAGPQASSKPARQPGPLILAHAVHPHVPESPDTPKWEVGQHKNTSNFREIRNFATDDYIP